MKFKEYLNEKKINFSDVAIDAEYIVKMINKFNTVFWRLMEKNDYQALFNYSIDRAGKKIAEEEKRWRKNQSR